MKYINKKNDTEFRNNMERDNDKKRKNNTHKDNMDRNDIRKRGVWNMEMLQNTGVRLPLCMFI